jgi:radical SAM superfamily enzyme YgiQ (UPF0313 family)
MNILFIVKRIEVEHLGLMLLSSLLKNEGHRVEACGMDLRAAGRRLKEGGAWIVGYSVSTFEHRAYLDFNRELKKKHRFFSVFGGPHPTFVPETIEEEGVDAVCRGEGEGALLELARRIEKGESVVDIKNLWVKDPGGIHRNPLRPRLEDLDRLPFPDRDLFPHGETLSKRKMFVETGRGCLFACAYCGAGAVARLYGNPLPRVRRRSVDNVLKEIRQAKERVPLRLVVFSDDLFASDPAWVRDFCGRYKTEIGLPFFCSVRADLIERETVRHLKDAGCLTVSMGLETANERLRREVFNRHLSQEVLVEAARMVKEEGMRLELTSILGIPWGTFEDDWATLELNRRCRPDYARASLLRPFFGTPIYEAAKSQGLLSEPYPSSFWCSSFRWQDAQEKRAVENLRKLFALAVDLPFPASWARRAARLPLGSFYKVIFLFWEGAIAFSRLCPTGWRGFYWGTLKYIRTFRFGMR